MNRKPSLKPNSASTFCAAAAATAVVLSSSSASSSNNFVQFPSRWRHVSENRLHVSSTVLAATPSSPSQTARFENLGFVGIAAVSTSAGALCRFQRRKQRRQSVATRVSLFEQDEQSNDGLGTMLRIPDGGVPEEDKIEVPLTIYEGPEEVTEDGYRPSGVSPYADKVYFWKMSKDKRTIEVIVPVEDFVEAKDVIYRLGEDPIDPKRGPTLELGYRKKTEDGRYEETIIVDGQILNSINTQDSFWMLDEMADVKVIVLTLTRPSMMRYQYDPILVRRTQEERIEPQTWDALLVEERIKPRATHKVFFDISLEGRPAGRLEFGLFGELLPKTVENFVGLCTGEYVDDDGNKQKSAFCYKGAKFSAILPNFLMSAGNAGLDHIHIKMTQEELQEYVTYFGDFKRSPEKIGQIEPTWAIRWGADLGLGEDPDGRQRKEGAATDGNSEDALQEILGRLQKLEERGTGATLIFYRPEWEKGCNVKGETFPAEAFLVPHGRRGMLSMDRTEGKDYQGSVFFITLKEFPEMDKRWVCFGELLSGWDLLNEMEENYEFQTHKVVIEDCGLLS